jgi:hypothetical protein
MLDRANVICATPPLAESPPHGWRRLLETSGHAHDPQLRNVLGMPRPPIKVSSHRSAGTQASVDPTSPAGRLLWKKLASLRVREIRVHYGIKMML